MTISTRSCIAQIEAPALPQRTPRERRIARISELTRAIDRDQKLADTWKEEGNLKGEALALGSVARKKAERDALMLQTDEGDSLDPDDPEVIRALGTPESRAAVESLIEAVSPEFTAPLPEGMPELGTRAYISGGEVIELDGMKYPEITDDLPF